MKKTLILLVIIIIAVTSCFTKSYDNKQTYEKMLTILKQQKEAYLSMQNAYFSDAGSYDEFVYTLEEIQLYIDNLPEMEREPQNDNDKSAITFNKINTKPRELKNKLIDIQALLYDAAISQNYSYFGDIIRDKALPARIDNLISRAESNGDYIPLDPEYTKFLLPIARENVEIDVKTSAL